MAEDNVNFQSVQTGKLPDKLLETAPVGKTVMIGLGGTGKEVLLRLRRFIAERFGNLDALPCIQFIHLDTDKTTNAQQQYDKNAADDPLYEKIKFQPFERVNLTIEGGISKYLANINAYPNIKEWFHTKGKIAALGDLGEGAGQIRMASRLGFFDKYNDIETVLRGAERRLGSEKNRDIISKLGFSFDPNTMNIYVVASFAGGTGSGTLLDMGFLVKTMFTQSSRIGIFFLPSFFAGYSGASRMKANGYAALKELNHYSFGNSFIGNWIGRDNKPLYPPPFDYTYLLEGKNESDEQIGSASEEYSMYQMVAETVFQEFSLGDFAGMKRAIRVNLKNFIDNAYVHNYWDAGGVSVQAGTGTVKGDSYTTRFCSFGLSAIYFPVEKVHRACACRLSRNILDLWQQNAVEDPLEILFTSFLVHPEIEFAQEQYTRRDGGGTIDKHDVEDALLMYNKDAGQNFQNYIWNKVIDIRREIELKPIGQKSVTLHNHRGLWEQLLAKADSDDPNEWGMDVRHIQQNTDQYIAKTEKGISENADKFANDPRYGISYALSLLGELKRLLKNENFSYIKYFEDSISYWDEHIRTSLDNLEQLQIEIGAHERQILFRTADLERDMNLLVPKDQKGEGILYGYFLARVMKQVAKRGKLICETIDKFLGEDSASGTGLLAKYHQLTTGLERLKERLENKESYFSKKEEYATLKSLYQDGDVTLWYNEWMGQPAEHKQNLKQVSDTLLSKIFKAASVSEALIYIQSRPIETIEDQVIEECRIFFASQPKQPSALGMLMDDSRCSKRERENLIETAYMRSKVWLKPTSHVTHVNFRIRGEQKPCIIGIDENDKVRRIEFENILMKKMGPGDTQPQFKNIGDMKKASIVFYNELGGATAFYPSSVTEVGGLKQNYDDFCRNPKDVSPDNQEDVHIAKNRFQFADIIPKTNEEVQKYSDSIRAFALARMLGVLKVQELKGDDQMTIINRYAYEQEVKFDLIEEDLGDEFAAVDILYQDQRQLHESHRKILYDQVESVVVDELHRKRLLSVYLLLIEFYLTNVYPPIMEDSGVAGVQLRRLSPFHAALDAERSRVGAELIRSEEERKQINTALSTLRGKRIGEKLSYQEYVEVLKPYTKMSGKFEVITKSIVAKRDFLDVPVLDRKKLFSDGKDVLDKKLENKSDNKPDKKSDNKAEISKQPQQPAKEFPKRQCPECGNLIDMRAVFCISCKKNIAKHITCQHCGETKVPDDLKTCWKCGREPQPPEEKIICQQCFSFEGKITEFPCRNCGWHPAEDKHKTEDEPLSSSKAEESQSANDNEKQQADKQQTSDQQAQSSHDAEKELSQKQPEPEVAEKAEIECPHCFSAIPAGSKVCKVCREEI